MKVGKVAIIGRPNSGKSTLINNLVGKKISIISPRPQTTQKITRGVYWDERGQIIFSDLPGLFKNIAPISKQELKQADVIVYLIDHCRYRGEEENLILGLVRKIEKPKIIAVNKIDILKPDYIHQYKFLEDEFDEWIEISALKKQHLKTLLKKIFEFLPEGKALFDPQAFETFPAMDISPKEFLAEIIREKAFFALRRELPYTISVVVEKIEEKENCFYIKGTVFTTSDHYKAMIIGRNARKIKTIGTNARKELELITGKKVFLDLQVAVNRH